MSSRSSATTRTHRKPAKKSLPASSVQQFRALLERALSHRDESGRALGQSVWGVYAFYDYDGEPIYVGQTKERLGYRVRRHLTNQRTDAVAMRILDTFEVAELELWPLWHLDGAPTSRDRRDASRTARFAAAQRELDATEHTAYLQAIERSKFGAILNEKIPPPAERVQLPPSHRFELITPEVRAERGHPDVRIARRAETIARLAAVAHERGEVSDGLRRVLVVQAVRLAYLSAARLAYVEGRPEPDPQAISVQGLVGSVLHQADDDGDDLMSAAET